MSAADSALRTIEWAMQGDGSPPRGDLRMAEQLAQPPPELLGAFTDALQRLTIWTAAKLGLDGDAVDGRTAVGIGGLVLAAAIAAREVPRAAAAMLAAVGAMDSPTDWVARHGIVEPTLRYLTEDLADGCRRLSPLTALLDRPVRLSDGRTFEDRDALAVAARLRNSAQSRGVLRLFLARPSVSAPVRVWRALLFERWRVGLDTDRAFVLDVYETTMVHHRSEAVGQIRQARSVMTRVQGAPDDAELTDAFSIAQWWGALWNLQRSHGDELRRRTYLHYDYLEGASLFHLHRRLTGRVR